MASTTKMSDFSSDADDIDQVCAAIDACVQTPGCRVPSGSSCAVDVSKQRGLALSLIEMIDRDRLKQLVTTLADRLDKDEKRQLRRIAENLVQGIWLKTAYALPSSFSSDVETFNIGRLAVKGLGLAALPRNIRGYLAEKHYNEIGISNSWLAICAQLFRAHSVPQSHLEIVQAFIDRREEVYAALEELEIDELDNRRRCKKFIQDMLHDFGEASVQKIADVGKQLKDAIGFDIEAFHRAVESGAKLVVASDHWTHEVEMAIRHRNKAYNNDLGTQFGTIILTVERLIMVSMSESLKSNDRFLDTPLNDRALVRKIKLTEKEIPIQLIRAAEEHIEKTTGFAIRIDSKPLMSDIADKVDDVCQSGKIQIRGLGSRDPKAKDLFIITNKCFIHGDSIIRVAPRILKHLLDQSLLSLGSACEIDLIHARSPGSNLWFEHPNVFEYLITTMDKNIIYESPSKKEVNYCVLSDMQETRKISEALKTLSVGALRSGVSSFDRITDSAKGRVFYRNGYFNLPTQRFISATEDPAASTYVRIEDDFDEDLFNRFSDEHPTIQKLRAKICFVFGKEADQKYVLKKLARAIGGHFDKVWNICRGERNAGKGVLERMCNTAFGAYSTTRSPPIMKTTNADPAAGQREIITRRLHIARIAFSNENSDEKSSETVLDGNAMKAQASGGDAVVCRQLFKDERAVRVTATSFFNMNAVPRIGGSPDCLETMQIINFPYKFEKPGRFASGLPTIKLADDSIKDWISSDPEIALGFAWLVYTHWTPNALTDADVPPASRMAREVHVGGTKLIDNHSIFGRYFEVGDKVDVIPLNVVYEVFKAAKQGEDVDLVRARGYLTDPTKLVNLRVEVSETRSPLYKDVCSFIEAQFPHLSMERKKDKITNRITMRVVIGLKIKPDDEDCSDDEEFA